MGLCGPNGAFSCYTGDQLQFIVVSDPTVAPTQCDFTATLGSSSSRRNLTTNASGFIFYSPNTTCSSCVLTCSLSSSCTSFDFLGLIHPGVDSSTTFGCNQTASFSEGAWSSAPIFQYPGLASACKDFDPSSTKVNGSLSDIRFNGTGIEVLGTVTNGFYHVVSPLNISS